MKLPQYTFDWRGILALFTGGFLPVFILSAANVALMFLDGNNLQYSDFFLVVSNLVMWLGAIMAFDYFVCRPQTGLKLNFNMSPTNAGTYLLIFPMMLGMMFVAEFITSLIPVSGPVFGKLYEYFSQMMDQLTQTPSTMILLTVIMAPLFEEIVFRGIIQRGLMNGGMKPMTAIWTAAVIFGIVHGNPWQFVGAVLLGFVLGTVYYRTHSLLLSIFLHAFNNLCSSLLMMYAGSESFADLFHLPEWILFVAGSIIFAVCYYFFILRNKVYYAE